MDPRTPQSTTSAADHSVLPTQEELQATQDKIVDALLEDAACRHPGVTAGLYTISQLAPFARLGHGVPVIRDRMNKNRDARRFKRATSDDHFRRRFDRAAPFLAGFDFVLHGMCVAGGAVSSLLMRSNSERKHSEGFHDFDLFLVGHANDEAAKEAIRELHDHLYAQWGGAGKVEVYRTQNCVTFRDSGLRPEADSETGETDSEGSGPEPIRLVQGPEPVRLVQVILRRYSTAAEVIHGFDLGSSAVLWDGDAIYMTALGKIAFEHGANVLNLAARRNSYERRLARYFDRGFHVVLPALNGCGLMTLEGRLPYLFAHGLEARGCACHFRAYSLYATLPDHDDFGRSPRSDSWGSTLPPEDSDYAYGGVAYGNKLSLTSRNVRALGGAEVRTQGLCAYALLVPGLDVFGIEPALDAETLASLASWTFRGGKINLKALTAYLGNDAAGGLALDYIASNGHAPKAADLIGAATRRCIELEPLSRIPFAFMRVEDKTALTGPFPRSLVTAAAWYGDAHLI